MGKKMLIDAAHREETRVAIVSGNRVENFDFESEAKRPLRGNIYLAKVTRVEPSLQAAFIEYGGNRHGFLAFSEIHPDYYQIPVADRERLLAEEAAEAEAYDDDDVDLDDEDDDDIEAAADSDDDSDDDEEDTGEAYDIGLNAFDADAEGDAEDDTDEDSEDDPENDLGDVTADADDASDDATSDDEEPSGSIAASAAEAESISEAVETDADDDTGEDDSDDEDTEASAADADDDASDDDDDSEDDAEDGDEEAKADGKDRPDNRRGKGRGRGRGRSNGRGRDGRRGGGDRRPSRRSASRHYKIQEVIKRRQILLVQVVKEERGNKGAALTTYLSLAGRYCVLMPNTARGGGISRKITNASDRRRLKEAMSEMDVSEGMGLIVRTAGANRTKVEIKRDFDYLLRLWENIRDLTLKSSAPCLIYEEGDLIKRSIRDQYTKDIDEIIVDGDQAYKDAKDFMRMLMPSHAKNVKRYKEREALLQRYGVQGELDSLLEPTVTLKSGGYIVINPTEALVSIDVNSGKSTKEHNIEATALSTNMEAAEEIARQLRLRDMAGLIVIDFIDMDEPRNNRAVERKLKDSLKQDRARIQVGRISSFGLLEMSRQRMRSGVLEGSTEVCPHCKGTGMIRSTESAALQVLRAVEAEALKGRAKALDVMVPVEIAVFILNQKRTSLLDIEKRCRVSIYLVADQGMIAPDYQIKRTDDRTPEITGDTDALSMESAFDEDEDAALDAEAEARAAEAERRDAEREERADTSDDEAGQKPKRRRRRRRKPSGDGEDADGSDAKADTQDGADASDEGDDASAADTSDDGDEDGDDKPRKRRRRGRRGGRRHRRTAASGEGDDADGNDASADSDSEDTADAAADTNADASADDASDVSGADTDDEEAPILVAYSSNAEDPVVVAQPAAAEETIETQADAEPEAEAETEVAAEEPEAETAESEAEAEAEPAPEPEPEPVLETADAAPEPSKPAKRGWWQRRK
ncbi:Rne/Rng family ribonuclease [Pyruvatibacter mobilis]|uniref:Rne/Rng family ribonuclease n=1 Tax=Pyruvatibacter mobilis TaxID=1712261 RepID=UPI003BA963BB